MSKSNASAMAFLQKKSNNNDQPKKVFKESFEEVKPAIMSGFRGMFGDYELEDKEKTGLQHILNDYYQPSMLLEEQVAEDYKNLTRITSEIKAISSQSILLHGERIKKAQDLLKNYREGAFSEWLTSTYGNRITPYGMLRYFELYNEIPPHARLKIEHMPRKAAYTLAIRSADLKTKIKLIEEYNGENQKQTILLIKELMPILETDKRGSVTKVLDVNRGKTSNEFVFSKIEKQIKKLIERKPFFSESDKKFLSVLLEQFKTLVD